MTDPEPDLSDRYNNGLVSPPDLAREAPRLQRPAWQPPSAQVQAARKQLASGIAMLVLALLVCICLALVLGWRP